MILFCLYAGISNAQVNGADNNQATEDRMIFTMVEQMPEFPGGGEALENFFLQNLRCDKKISGKVYINFLVEKDGTISNISLSRGITGSELTPCDEEVLKVAAMMPKWIPGKQSGKPVIVRCNYDVYVNLENREDDMVYSFAETPPAYPGGEKAMLDFIKKNTKYPPGAIGLGIHTDIWVSFVVRKDGTLTDIKITNGIGGVFDEEAIRVVSSMPKWSPGKNEGRAVNVEMSVIVPFVLK